MDLNYVESLVVLAKTGDKQAKEKIIEEFRPFIINLSNKTYIHGYEFSDIQNECYCSLLKAINLYDIERHRFVAYASRCIRLNLYDLIRCNLSKNKVNGKETLELNENLDSLYLSDNTNIDELVITKQNYQIINKALNNLSTEEKRLFKHLIIDNKPLTDYAFINNIYYHSAQSQKNKLLKKLHNLIQ